MLLGGYLIAGFGPVVLGLVRDATGDFGAMIWLLVALSAVLVAACLALTPTRLQRGIASAASGVASEPA
jgi:cyanate permease